MKVYCTSKNSGPSWNHETTSVVYLGTSLVKARESVGTFQRYQKAERAFPADSYKSIYSGLPNDIPVEFVHYYMADVWWYSIVSFELNEEE